MPEELIVGALVSAAVSTAGGLLVSTLIKPGAAQSPVSYPLNSVERGGYLPLVMGRRIVGPHVGWVGARDAINIHSGGGSSMGGGGGSSQSWMEGGWHQLCHGPVRQLYRIFQGDNVLYGKLIDNTTTADGSQFSCNVAPAGDIFEWRSGRDPRDTPFGASPYQPVSAWLQTKAGLVSAYPGLCDVLWRRKYLGGSPQWPLMKYDIRTFAADFMAAAALYDPFTPAGVQIDFDESTPAESVSTYVTVWLNGKASIPAGTYKVTYLQGAYKLNAAAAGWQANSPDAPAFDLRIVGTSGTTVTTLPYTDHSFFPTQAAAESANIGASLTFSWPGGPMGIRFGDLDYHPGMVPGQPNPTYSVQLSSGGAAPTYRASMALQAGAAGSGDSGWNPAAALYVLLCAGFPYGCGIEPTSIDTDALVTVGATLAAERRVVNLLVDQGQQADAIVGALMADMGFLMPQIGNVLTPYPIRTETTVQSLPDDLIGGALPEQERQVAQFGGDRYTFQFDDIANNFATSDVTIDNDAQAFSNNRPQAQTVKLSTVTNRTDALAVAVRRAVELIADGHKVPSLTLLREARNPAFHPGRTFILQGVRYRIIGWRPDSIGTSAEIDAVLDQYGDVSITYDADNGDGSYNVPPGAPPEPDLYFDPLVLPRTEWPSTSSPVFGVPRVRAVDSVIGATVWIAAASTGPFTQVGNQDEASAGGTLVTAFNATPGLLTTGPKISPLNDDITDGVPDLSGDDADYNAGVLLLVCELEIMLLRSITPQTEGSYLLNDVTRGAYGTTVVAHSIGTPCVIVQRELMSPLTSSLLVSHQGQTLWVKTQPTDGQQVVDLSLVTPEPLLVPLNLLATIAVTGPTGGTVYIGQPVTTTWTTSQLTGTLDLSYSTDAGVTWTSIATGVTDSGTYTWSTTGLSAAAAVIVRVASTTTPSVYGVSYPFALATPVAPGAPTGLTATAGDTSATLTWTAPVGGVGPQLYRVKRGTATGGPYTTVATVYVPPGETLPTTYVDGGLTNGTPYYWVVTAVANGAESSASNEATATPAVPTGGGGSGGTGIIVAGATRAIWLDAGQITGITDGTSLGEWDDATANGASVTQTTGTMAPVYHTNVVNGRAAVHFDGTDDGMGGGPAIGGGFGGPYAAFIVFRTSATGDGRAMQSTSGTRDWYVGPRSGGHLGAGASGTAISATSAPLVAGTWYCASLRYDGTSVSFRVNGVDYTEDSTYTDAPSGFGLGAAFYHDEPLDGDVAEAILYDGTVTDAERTTIEGALSTKYALGF